MLNVGDVKRAGGGENERNSPGVKLTMWTRRSVKIIAHESRGDWREGSLTKLYFQCYKCITKVDYEYIVNTFSCDGDDDDWKIELQNIVNFIIVTLAKWWNIFQQHVPLKLTIPLWILFDSHFESHWKKRNRLLWLTDYVVATFAWFFKRKKSIKIDSNLVNMTTPNWKSYNL